MIKADDQVIYDSDFETANDSALYNGGCREGAGRPPSAARTGWQYVAADQDSPAEHAYLLEMRDRSGFDAHGQGESDRGDLTFEPGVLLAYTDEDHGYGNVGTADPPAQTPLDSRPEPGSETPNLDDAAFKAGDAFSDGGAGHTDNYTEGDGNWVLKYGCLSFSVDRLAGDGDRAGGRGRLRPQRRRLVHHERELRAVRLRQRRGERRRPDAAPHPRPPSQEQRRRGRRRVAAPDSLRRRRRRPPPPPRRRRRASCKARCDQGARPAALVPHRVPVVRREDADGHVPPEEGRARPRRPAQGLQGRAQGAHDPLPQGLAHLHAARSSPKGLKAGKYTLRLRATRAGRTTTLKLPVTRTR